MRTERRERLGPEFAKLWASSTTSALGSGLTTVAAPLLVASRTTNPLVVSAAFGATWLPWLLFTLPGGVLVDRVDRRRLMRVIDAARFCVMGLLGLDVADGHPNIALLYTALFVINAGEVVFRSASSALIPSVVPTDRLERANGLLLGSATLMQMLVAGPLGGLLFAVSASLPFLTDSGTYAISALFITLVAGTYRPGLPNGTGTPADPSSGGPGTTRRRGSMRREIAEGFGWLFRQRMLRTMAVLIGLLNLTFTAATAVLVLLAKERLHLGSVGYGLLLAYTAAGSILASAFGDRIIRRFTASWTIRIGLLVEAGFHLTLAASTNRYLIAVVLFAFGAHGALWSIVGGSLRQRLTPSHLRGRVQSTTIFIAGGGNVAGALLGGLAAARFGITSPYWAGFVLALVVTAATWHVFDRDAVRQAYAQRPDEPGVTVATAG